MESMTGVVKKLFADKLYGFIRGEDGVERFFHATGCVTPFAQLREGAAVTFTHEAGAKGPRAEDVDLDEPA